MAFGREVFDGELLKISVRSCRGPAEGLTARSVHQWHPELRHLLLFSHKSIRGTH